jgi:soluble lytic murein transglycosylase
VNRRWIFPVLLLALLGGMGAYWRYYEWRDHSQDGAILAAARHYGVEPALVKAVVWRESRFNAEARGSRGEIGLMQIIPNAAAKDWAVAEHLAAMPPEQLLNPGTNTLAGAWYLARLFKRYAQTDNPVPYVLADYNAGRGNVLKWKQGAASTNSEVFLSRINFPTTKSYVQSVMRRYEHYRPIFPSTEVK